MVWSRLHVSKKASHQMGNESENRKILLHHRSVLFEKQPPAVRGNQEKHNFSYRYENSCYKLITTEIISLYRPLVVQ